MLLVNRFDLETMTAEGKACRHEYVRIYQRRLKGLERRLVATRAYLPVGFKIGDFGHLSEGSYCFCVTCRKRLFPKRSQQEKDLARLEKQQAKLAGITAGFAADDNDAALVGVHDQIDGEQDVVRDELDDERSTDFDDEEGSDEERDNEPGEDEEVDVHVEELEVESVDVEDIKAEGVKLVVDDDFEEACELDENEES